MLLVSYLKNTDQIFWINCVQRLRRKLPISLSNKVVFILNGRDPSQTKWPSLASCHENGKYAGPGRDEQWEIMLTLPKDAKGSPAKGDD